MNLSSLAGAIIRQAVEEWRVFGDLGKPRRGPRPVAWRQAQALGYENPREELLDFFCSDYFLHLCNACRRDPFVITWTEEIPIE